jgi:hypothetical protein
MGLDDFNTDDSKNTDAEPVPVHSGSDESNKLEIFKNKWGKERSIALTDAEWLNTKLQEWTIEKFIEETDYGVRTLVERFRAAYEKDIIELSDIPEVSQDPYSTQDIEWYIKQASKHDFPYVAGDNTILQNSESGLPDEFLIGIDEKPDEDDPKGLDHFIT